MSITFGVVEGISPSKDPFAELNDPQTARFLEQTTWSPLRRVAGTGTETETTNPFHEDEVHKYSHVRRPMRGIQLKRETFATMAVIDQNDEYIPIVNESYQSGEATTPYYDRTSNFILQAVAESRTEKTQIVQTFDNSYIFFYGEQPRVINFSGMLLNTADFQWRTEWWENYNTYFRGTQLVRSKRKLQLRWDDITVEGYILGSSCSEQSQAPYHIQLQFQLFVTRWQRDHLLSAFFPDTYFNGELIDTSEYTTTKTAAGKVRSLSLSRYLGDSLTTYQVEALMRGGGPWFDRAAGFNSAAKRALDLAKQVMFGRMLSIPSGAAGSEAAAGLEQATLAAGTGLDLASFEAIFARSEASLRTLSGRKYGRSRLLDYMDDGNLISRTRFRDNFDEFPRGSFVSVNGENLRMEDIRKESLKVLQESAALGRPLVLSQEDTKELSQITEDTFRNYGIDPEWGTGLSGMLIAMAGRASLAAVTVTLQPLIASGGGATTRQRAVEDEVLHGEEARGTGVSWYGF